jgi:hypothetical protein
MKGAPCAPCAARYALYTQFTLQNRQHLTKRIKLVPPRLCSDHGAAKSLKAFRISNIKLTWLNAIIPARKTTAPLADFHLLARWSPENP